MNNRRVWYAICLFFMLAVRIHQHMTHRSVEVGVMLEPLIILWSAFVIPAAPLVMMIERYGFHLDPWADGNNTLSLFWLTLTASVIWFFPPRIARWFGTFDAVGDAGKRRLPSPVRGAAHALDFLNKRLFGRQKTGGWA